MDAGQMTLSTLITGVVIALGIAALIASLILGAMLVYTGRRIGNVRELAARVAQLEQSWSDLHQQFLILRNRTNVNQSRWKKKAEKEAEEEEEQPALDVDPREALVKRFNGGHA